MEYGWWPAHTTGPAMSARRGRRRSNREDYVTAAAIEYLMSVGYAATAMSLERTIERGSRPDLVIEPDAGPIIVWESKPSRPATAARTQARRYAAAAARRWPGRAIRVVLAWPTDRMDLPRGMLDLSFEVYAS